MEEYKRIILHIAETEWQCMVIVKVCVLCLLAKVNTLVAGDVLSLHSCDQRYTESLTQLCNHKSTFTIRFGNPCNIFHFLNGWTCNTPYNQRMHIIIYYPHINSDIKRWYYAGKEVGDFILDVNFEKGLQRNVCLICHTGL